MLNQAIQRLYSTFGTYPLRDAIDSCPCCRGPHETRHLHTKPLRDLTAEDLELFTFHAMTTVGDVDDFKHFLPRILELVPSGDFPVDKEVVLGKLRYGIWKEWPAIERVVLEAYLAELWTWARRQPPDPYSYVPAEIGSWLCAIARAEDDLGRYLHDWESDQTPEAHANFLRFVSDERPALGGSEQPGAFWEDSVDQWQQLKSWINRLESTGDSL